MRTPQQKKEITGKLNDPTWGLFRSGA